MTFIAKDGGRTVTNCSVYDRRKVYEIVTSVVLDVCRSEWNEVVRTGEQVTEQVVYHVIAQDEDLAKALFKRKWGSEFQRTTMLSIKPLFVIDAEIAAENN